MSWGPIGESAGPGAPACAAALASLPGIGPATLAGLVRHWGPQQAWARVVTGEVRRPDPPFAGKPAKARLDWSTVAGRFDVDSHWRLMQSRDIAVTFLGHTDFPVALATDLQPPSVLFWRGDLASLDRPCVAIVGTRRCTHYGSDVARSLARELAASGLCVVSGLALGIDGAAHAGALEAGCAQATVGVAASGVDVPYPRRHRQLWERVVDRGAVISETPPGSPAQSWRFPSRNRVIAGLGQALIVVESAAGGGSMLTVAAALDRGREVLAVPGPVHSPVSEGTNQLLAEGAGMVRNAADVLDCLGKFLPLPPSPAGPAGVGLSPCAVRVLNAVDWTPTPTGEILQRTGMDLGRASVELQAMERAGLVAGGAGWWERRRPATTAPSRE